jgi:hypothetical protein
MTLPVAVPTGLAADGERRRDARVRALTAEDELLLLDAERTRPAAETVTLLLARCVTAFAEAQVTSDLVRNLTVGDREALLLHIRRATFGERMQCVIRCASAACGAPMDLELLVRDLLTDAPSTEMHDGTIGGRSVRFRLPTGADQEAVAPFALRDPRLAGEMLLARCVVSDAPAPFTAEDRAELAAAFANADPQAEITLALICPSCDAEFVSLFDAGSFLIREAVAAARELLREVHLLAMVYHWSERDILGMSDRKRRLYLSLIAESQPRRRA